MLLAVVALLLGLAMTGMGAWLVFLGGSFYYLLAGIAITLAAVAMLAGREDHGVGLFALVVAATLVWSFTEISGKGWMPSWGFDMAGRVGVLFGLLVLMAIALAFRRRRRTIAVPARRAHVGTAGIAVALVAVIAVTTDLVVDRVAAQSAPSPSSYTSSAGCVCQVVQIGDHGMRPV